jgi:hypothetical protein
MAFRKTSVPSDAKSVVKWHDLPRLQGKNTLVVRRLAHIATFSLMSSYVETRRVTYGGKTLKIE